MSEWCVPHCALFASFIIAWCPRKIIAGSASSGKFGCFLHVSSLHRVSDVISITIKEKGFFNNRRMCIIFTYILPFLLNAHLFLVLD